MANADGCQQEPETKRAMASADGGQQEPVSKRARGGSIVAVPDSPQVSGGAQQMPERLTIGTKKAFGKNYPFVYEKKEIGSETIYVCNKGSDWALSNEVLVLRRENGTWTAFDGAVNADGSTLQCRQARMVRVANQSRCRC